jgi:hypothetical protein
VKVTLHPLLPRSEERRAARRRARGRVEPPINFDVGQPHFTEPEWANLRSASEKLKAQRRPPGLPRDLSVLTDLERLAVKKCFVLAEYGIWRPEFGPMEKPELLKALSVEGRL